MQIKIDKLPYFLTNYSPSCVPFSKEFHGHLKKEFEKEVLC